MARPEVDSVSAAGVRDGDPAALAAFCTACGPAALAYAGAVCPPGLALQAAAEAFARTRAVLSALGADGPAHPDLERLLLGAVRRTTAELCPPAARGPFGARKTCAQVPTLVAARLEGELSPSDAQRLAEHLARDGACRSIEARFLAAERAWADPPAGRLTAEAATAVVGALAAAAPILAAGDGGADPLRPPEVEPDVRAADPAAPQETGEADPVAAPEAAPVPVPVRPDDRAEADAPAPPDPPAAPEPPPADAPPPPDDAAPDPVLGHEPVEPVVDVPAPEPDHGPAAPAAGPPAFARGRRHRPVHESGHGIVRTVVLPLTVVGVAAVIAMAIAGVFGEDQPQLQPPAPPITARAETIPAPSAPMPTTPAPEVGEEPPPPEARGSGEGEDALGGLGLPGPGTSGAPAG